MYRKNKVLIFLLVLILIFISGCGTKDDKTIGGSIFSNCRQVEEKYQEPYTEQEPYQAIEEELVPIKYRVEKAVHYQSYSDFFDVFEKGEILLTNTDDVTGTFTVEQTFTTLLDGSKTLKKSIQIMPGESITFIEEYDRDANEDVTFVYRVIPDRKTVQKVVTKYRDVTKYREALRTVEKCE